MNILLTCAGRRNYLVDYFREALHGRGKIFAADTNADAAALQEADDYFLVPPVDDSEYFDKLRDICRLHRISLLISLNDLELPLLARERGSFLEIGTVPVISSAEIIDMCFDKYKTDEFLRAHNIAVPLTYTTLEEAQVALERGDIAFPLIIKPRWGTASIGIDYIEDIGELELAYRLARKRITRTILAEVSRGDIDRSILIQECIAGEEFCLDITNDLQGDYVCTFAKRKLSKRAGEADRMTTVNDGELDALGALIGRTLGHTGILDCDVFRRDGKCYLIDINPRFGGAYPFAHVAGANIPAALIAWANGEKPDSNWLRVRPNVTSSKCDRLVISAHGSTLSVDERGSAPGLAELRTGDPRVRDNATSAKGESL
ncbi:MAG: ATP-grasp domain-containing protein [Candidatus Aquicultor sp.]|nr:ATP-grasp domain-containing protein [Candidatus Aquicultor sp.]